MNGDQLLREMYGAFNARDLEAVLAVLAEDVDWPNAWEGGRLHGREAVRDYWTRQWAAIDPSVEPVSIERCEDGRLAVDVHQIVRDLSGEQLADNRVRHLYTLRDGLIARMDVREGAPHGETGQAG